VQDDISDVLPMNCGHKHLVLSWNKHAYKTWWFPNIWPKDAATYFKLEFYSEFVGVCTGLPSKILKTVKC